MSCAEFLAGLQDLLDAELPGSDRERLSKHVELCPPCADKYQALRDLKLCLRHHGRPDAAPAGLAEKIARQVRAHGISRRRNWRWALAGLTAAALLASLIGVWASWEPRERVPADLAKVLVERHVRYLGYVDPAELATADCAELEDWYRQNHMAVDILFPEFRHEDLKLVGGRRCGALKKKMAVLFYTFHNRRVTLFALDAQDLAVDLEPMASRKVPCQADASGPFCTLERREGYQLVYWRNESVIFALVGDMHEAELDDLLASASER